ncbi:hypothetical protein [Streptomyces coffeae]|uniref:Uncharacterized protein n=1 Tax=Streptomyces coffeae TaxID=621382 RepID=A0ABS1NJ82_9ACTN|nr:hypothetical protein [Streptomyces coffeae]MBL1100096.1 hypothetical protein [Streptomyces coffeae]
MNVFTVAAAIAALDGADWLPPTAHWEIATTDGVWGAHAEINAQSEAQAYRLMEPLAVLHASKLADDGRSITVDFALDEVPFRFWWLRPVKRYVVPEQCATCPTKLGAPGVAFVRLGAGRETPVICVPCRDRMHRRWTEGDAARDGEVLREAAAAVLARPHCDGCAPGREGAAEQLFAMADKAEPAGETTGQPAELTVYRASHESITFGHYVTREAAREHCETLVRREDPNAEIAWTDEDDGVQDLTLHVNGEFQDWSGYVVTALTVAAAYDEEADE